MKTEITDTSQTNRLNVLRTEDGVTTYKGGSTNRVSATSSVTGDSLPNWRRIIREGRNATTYLSGTNYALSPVRITADCWVGQNPKFSFHTPVITCDYWSHRVSGIPDPNVISDAAMDRSDLLARERFFKKYRARRTAFQSGVFFGEIRETVHMIKSPAKALREGINRYYRTVKKRLRKNRNPKKSNRIVRDTWLEYAFGWRPLIRDVSDALDLAKALPERYMQPIKAQNGYLWKDDPVRTQKSADFIGYPYWFEITRNEYLAEVIYRGAASATMGTPTFSEQMGLSWSSLLPTIWELIPYSFLVDYFSNVGEVIEGISTGTISLAWGACTRRRVVERTISTENDLKSLQGAVGHKNCRSYVYGSGSLGRRSTVIREPIDQIYFGITDLRFEVPGIGSLKWLNLAALAQLRR